MPKRNKNRISVQLITLNEEKDIKSCLESVEWNDDIILIDSYSSDKTVEIAKKYTDKIYFRKFTGDYSEQRNFALSRATGEWVMVLDADEKLPDNSESIIKKLIREKDVDGYWFPRRNYINEKIYLKHGYFYPDWQLRLFRNSKSIRYKGVVHELPEINRDRTKRIRALEIIHKPSHTKYNSFFSFQRFLPFIKTEVQSIIKSDLSLRAYLKESCTNLLRHFYRSFVKEKGYKDGYAGFRAAFLYALYRSVIYLYAAYLNITRKT